MPRGQGIGVTRGLGGSECGPVRRAVGGPIRSPERVGRAGRVPERGAKLTGAGCA